MSVTQQSSDNTESPVSEQARATKSQDQQQSDDGHTADGAVSRRQSSDGHLGDDEPDDEAGKK